MSAAGFADLCSALAFLRPEDALGDSYFSTERNLCASTAASSLTKIGRLPVSSNCWIVATTISSDIPSMSTLFGPVADGDAGGDNCCFGFSSLILMVVVLGGLIDPCGVDCEACVVFDIFLGRSDSSPSAIVLGGEGCEIARLRLGMAMPRSASERLFRRVLYGMTCVGDIHVCRR